jgi:hypothetical protein
MFLKGERAIAIFGSIEFRVLNRPKASKPGSKSLLPVDKFSGVLFKVITPARVN